MPVLHGLGRHAAHCWFGGGLSGAQTGRIPSLSYLGAFRAQGATWAQGANWEHGRRSGAGRILGAWAQHGRLPALSRLFSYGKTSSLLHSCGTLRWGRQCLGRRPCPPRLQDGWGAPGSARPLACTPPVPCCFRNVRAVPPAVSSPSLACI